MKKEEKAEMVEIVEYWNKMSGLHFIATMEEYEKFAKGEEYTPLINDEEYDTVSLFSKLNPPQND